jgi:hypothetical protein
VSIARWGGELRSCSCIPFAANIPCLRLLTGVVDRGPHTTGPAACSVANCTTCATGNASVCTQCMAGFNLTGGLCSKREHSPLGEGVVLACWCIPGIAPIPAVTTKLTPLRLLTVAVDVRPHTLAADPAACSVANCTTCATGNASVCTQCTSGYNLNGGQCVKCEHSPLGRGVACVPVHPLCCIHHCRRHKATALRLLTALVNRRPPRPGDGPAACSVANCATCSGVLCGQCMSGYNLVGGICLCERSPLGRGVACVLVHPLRRNHHCRRHKATALASAGRPC